MRVPHTSGLPDVTAEPLRWPQPSCPSARPRSAPPAPPGRAAPAAAPERVLLPRTAAGHGAQSCAGHETDPLLPTALRVFLETLLFYFFPLGRIPSGLLSQSFHLFFFFFLIIISYLFLISRFKSPKLESVILVISLFPRPRAGPLLPSSALPTAQTFPAGSCGASGERRPRPRSRGARPGSRSPPSSIFLFYCWKAPSLPTSWVTPGVIYARCNRSKSLQTPVLQEGEIGVFG